VIDEPTQLNFKRGYKNNPLLKRTGTRIEWTPEAVEEYRKCSESPQDFIETYMKIVHLDHGLIPFKLRGYQIEMINAIHTERRVIMCMARQSGKSTAVIGYILWYILFNPHVTAALLANKEKTALEILNKLHVAYMHLPLFIQQGVMEWNKGSITLENGSRVIADSTSADTVRGYAISLLVVDETAHIEHWEEFSTSVIPTISSAKTSKIVQISTPKGLNHFYNTWINAQPEAKNPNGYYPIMVHWTAVPDRDAAWQVEALKELNNDTDKFAQEYECEFIGSSGTLIAGWKLKELMKTYATPIVEKDNLSKYQDPIRDHKYVMTVDVSEGKGLDYSAFHVIDVTALPYQQVCTYHSNQSTPIEFTEIIFNTAKSYNEALILVEYESLGPQVSDALFNTYEYEGLLSTESAGSRGKRISTKGGKTDKGIKMSITVRTMGCSLLKLLVEQGKLIVNDYNTIAELATFSREEGKQKYEAEEGCHDDLVMSLVVFAWLSDQDYFSDYTGVQTLAQLREKDVKAIEDDLTLFGFVDKGTPEVEVETVKAYRSWIVANEIEDDEELHNF
jgi:hypothetical protein